LQAYLDEMTSLMLDKKELLSSELGDPIFTLARARTITVIARLDANHNKSVTTFLTEAGLTGYDYPSACTLSEIELSTSGGSCSKDVTGNVRLISLLSVVELRGADLQGATLRGADLSSANINDANLRSADLYEANLSTAAKLVRTDLSNADLSFANLSTANLTDADLSGADLSAANSGEVLFKSANLSDATLPGANLTEANLSGANLTEAVLSSTPPNIPPITTILTDADLSGADLTHARGVTGEDLEQQAKSLEGATKPNGQKYEDWLKSRGEDGNNSGPS
jgi:uncharacterized protein YjbI with pentapeptide repeats